jgi:hypothetical protein
MFSGQLTPARLMTLLMIAPVLAPPQTAGNGPGYSTASQELV